jgi:hypothetical protein
MISIKKIFAKEEWAIIRVDIARVALLAVVAALLWCTAYHRWTPESWQTPLTYLSEPEKGDVLGLLADVRAAEDGHFYPFEFTDIPELGAPHTANWNDYPTTEKPIILLMGWLARGVGIFAAANFAVLLGQVLAVVGFYTACRLLNASWIWSCAGALVFAFSRFAFAHGLHHLTVAYVWHVPLCLVVCEWLMRGEGIKLGERRFGFALIVAFITGVQNVYYTYLFVQLVFFGGLIQAWRRGWRQALPAAAIIGTSAAAFALMNLNTIVYHMVYGENVAAVVREYRWLEIYGLKLVDLVVPPPDHVLPPFAAWGANHLKEVVLSPGEMPPTAYLGLLGLGALAWLVVVSGRRALHRAMLPLEAFVILWIILYASVGGINSVLGAVGFQMFRSTTRYSIFILCIVLMYAVRRLSLLEIRQQALVYGLAAGAVLIAWWDQVPPSVTAGALAEISTQVASDRHFTENMEQRLSPGAMVFQIPIMDFPESPAPGIGSYDHFRPYLYSRQLRFSFGTDKGRPEADWQRQLAGLSLDGLVAQLASDGFAAIYVNRNGLAGNGDDLVKAFKAMGLGDMIESDRGDLFCVVLKKP